MSQATKDEADAVFEVLLTDKHGICHKLSPENDPSQNNLCFDCNSRNTTWSSVSFGIYLCINCSGLHRNLGVNISFVRSTSLDTWHYKQLYGFIKGGNKQAKEYFMRNGLHASTALAQKYNNRVAAIYKQRILLQEGASAPISDADAETYVKTFIHSKKALMAGERNRHASTGFFDPIAIKQDDDALLPAQAEMNKLSLDFTAYRKQPTADAVLYGQEPKSLLGSPTASPGLDPQPAAASGLGSKIGQKKVFKLGLGLKQSPFPSSSVTASIQSNELATAAASLSANPNPSNKVLSAPEHNPAAAQEEAIHKLRQSGHERIGVSINGIELAEKTLGQTTNAGPTLALGPQIQSANLHKPAIKHGLFSNPRGKSANNPIVIEDYEPVYTEPVRNRMEMSSYYEPRQSSIEYCEDSEHFSDPVAHETTGTAQLVDLLLKDEAGLQHLAGRLGISASQLAASTAHYQQPQHLQQHNPKQQCDYGQGEADVHAVGTLRSNTQSLFRAQKTSPPGFASPSPSPSSQQATPLQEKPMYMQSPTLMGQHGVSEPSSLCSNPPTGKKPLLGFKR